MKKIYRIHVLGDIPHDLKEKVACLHAAGILETKKIEKAPNTNSQNYRKSNPSTVGLAN